MTQMLPNSTKVVFFNIVPSPRDDRDDNVDRFFELPLRYPKRLNLTPYLGEVRNQGIQGTSVTHAAINMLEWRERKLNKNEIQFSPQFLYNLRDDRSKVYMGARELMKILVKFGCCTEESCPYGKEDMPNTEQLRKEAEEYKIKGYARINTVSTLKMTLNVFGPCLIMFPVFNHTSAMWKQHRDEQWKLGGHAMAVIGYNKEGFILRNSWGKYWEKNGCCIYPYSDWGYHDEVWCIADEETNDLWKKKYRYRSFQIAKKMANTVYEKSSILYEKIKQEHEKRLAEMEERKQKKLLEGGIPKPRKPIKSKKDKGKEKETAEMSSALDNAEKIIEEQVLTSPEQLQQMDSKLDHSSDVMYSTYNKSSQDVIKQERNPSIYEMPKKKASQETMSSSSSISQTSPYVFQRNKNKFQQSSEEEPEQEE